MTYGKYIESGVQWLGKIPAHWKVRPLKAVATCNDEVLPEGTDPEQSIEYVEISGVSEGRQSIVSDATTFGVAPSRARRIVRQGDVLISTVRTYLRAIATINDPPENLVASTGFAVIRPRNVLHRYLGYALHCEYFISQVIARSVGVSYPAITASELMTLKCPVPDPDEQLAIADFLDRETAKLVRLIDAQERLIDLLEEKRRVAVARALTRGLDSAPVKVTDVQWNPTTLAHWTITRLANLFRDVDERGNESLPVLTVSIHDGVSDDETPEEESERKVVRSDDRTKYKCVKPGDLVYNMMRAWQGGFGTVTVDGMVSPAYVVARPTTDYPTLFIERLLRTPAAIEEIRGRSRGVTDFRLRLYWDEFREIVVCLPPPEEAAFILQHLDAVDRRVDAAIDAARKSIALLQERRAAIISAAVTGRLDVRESSRGPSSHVTRSTAQTHRTKKSAPASATH